MNMVKLKKNGATQMQINMTKQKLIKTFACLLAINLSACGGEQSAQQMQMPPSTVNYTIPNKTNIPVTSNLIRRTSAARTAEVRPQVSGVNLKRMFTEGS